MQTPSNVHGTPELFGVHLGKRYGWGIKLTWSDANPQKTHYEIDESHDGVNWRPMESERPVGHGTWANSHGHQKWDLDLGDGAGTQRCEYNLISGGVYFYRLRTWNGSRHSGWAYTGPVHAHRYV